MGEIDFFSLITLVSALISHGPKDIKTEILPVDIASITVTPHIISGGTDYFWPVKLRLSHYI